MQLRYLDRWLQEIQQDVVLAKEDMHEYQHKAVQFLKDNPYSALFIDLGLGKSVISLTTILDMVCDFTVDEVLVVAPIKVARNTWPEEIKLWEHTTALKAKQIRSKELIDAVNKEGKRVRAECKAKGMKNLETEALVEKARRKLSRQLLVADYENNKAHVHIINREQIEWLVDSWGRKFPYKVMFIDESDSMKDHRTGRFKAVARIRPMLTRLHELTATPTAESYLHLFAQIYLLDLGERLGRSYTAFVEEYFSVNQYSREVKLKVGSAEKLAEKISDICLTMKAEDYLTLKKAINITDTVVIPQNAMRLYEELERESVVSLPNGVEVEAENAAALSQKLLQLSSGFLYDTTFEPDGNGELKPVKRSYHIHDEKLNKLAEIEEEHDENLLVAYWHKSSLERLKKRFPHAVVMDKQGEAIKKWNRGEIRMLLVHPQSSGHGLNIQKGGRRVVFFDIPWSLGLYLQLVGRLCRQGQINQVYVHHIVTEGTIDELVVECLKGKGDLQELLFKLLKEYRKRFVKTKEKS